MSPGADNTRIKVEHLKIKGIHLNGDRVKVLASNFIRQALKVKIKAGKHKRKRDPLWLLAQTLNKIIQTSSANYQLEGHFTYGSSPLNADVLSELSKNRGFKLAALDITSIPGHIEEFRIYMNSKCIDILAVNETRLDDTISKGEVTWMPCLSFHQKLNV